jgi:galactose mutarotase-like enzyme
MAAKAWIVTDVAQAVYTPDLRIDADQLAGAPLTARIVKRTLRGGLSEGVDEIRIHNGRFEFAILPTRGMGLWRGWLGDQTVGWQSPVRGPVHPCYVPLTEPSGLGWLDGFDEWICRCGATSNGAPEFNEHGQLVYPLHGQLANRPAHHVEVSVDGDEIAVRGEVDECRFHFQKLRLTTTIRTRFNQPGLEIEDRITNLSASQAEMQMLYHCNFGAPLLGAGAEVLVPAQLVVPRNDWAAAGLGHWPTFSQPTPSMEEQVYFFRMLADADDQTQVLLRSADGRRGATLGWNTRQLPCFSLWKNETAIADGYVAGLEPGTNFPNPRSFEAEQGRVVVLEGGASYTMKLDFRFHATAADVQQAESQVRQLQGNRQPELRDSPDSDWCA